MTENELAHYGVKGMRWGVRRYRNKDGTLTAAGRRRVSNAEVRYKEKEVFQKEYKKLTREYGVAEKKKDAIAYGKKTQFGFGRWWWRQCKSRAKIYVYVG